MRSLKVWKGEYPPDLALPDYGGDECVVMVHGEDNFKGWMAKYGEGDFNIHRIFSKGAKDRDASSVRVRGKDCKAVLFSSWRVQTKGLVSDPLVEGDYDTASLEAAGFKDNAMRAMRIWKGEHPMFPNDGPHQDYYKLKVPDFGGDECVVIVYGKDNFQGEFKIKGMAGWHVVFGEGDINIHDFMRFGGVNKDASSV